MHVHVAHPDGEAKFWLTPQIELARAIRACQVSSCEKLRKLCECTSRRFKMPGTSTSAVEVTHIFKQGFWILLDREELLLPFAEFPWFQQATIEQISNIEWPTADHLYWPQLDVDLSVESIRHPEKFPLRANLPRKTPDIV